MTTPATATRTPAFERVPPPLLAAGYARLPDITAALGVAHSTTCRSAQNGHYGKTEKISGCFFVNSSTFACQPSWARSRPSSFDTAKSR